MAERTITRRQLCMAIPEGLDDVTVAAMMNPGMSAWAALAERAHFEHGESVLILGATGSAGHMAVQIAKRLGARRIVAAGRDPQALDTAKVLGADATISLIQDRDALVAALRAEISGGINVVLDYLWGAPAEATLEAIAQKGLSHAAARIRYVQIGSSAGSEITLPAATLRSSGLEMLGSGFGSVSMERLFALLHIFLLAAAELPFTIEAVPAPLQDVEQIWNVPESRGRVVFRP